MKTRRNFILNTGLTTFGLAVSNQLKGMAALLEHSNKYNGATVIATWNNHKAALAAWQVLEAHGLAIDAVEAGARVPEADPLDTSVGYGGYPDRDGNVTLDASIMDHMGNAGGVMFLEGIMHPISVARRVMEKTPHVFLVGAGAKGFALAEGFKEENLLTPVAEKAWKEWLKKSEYQPKINVERHDTIGILAQDHNRDLSGACTTSGLAFKMKGRVGDSPIIGAGLYVDNQVGAATATGLGEAVIKKVGSFSIVEMMRNGKGPQKACENAIKRLLDLKGYKDLQVGYIAINKQGEIGGYSLQPGFQYIVARQGKLELINANSYIKP